MFCKKIKIRQNQNKTREGKMVKARAVKWHEMMGADEL
jgi:hypothetical protein